MKDWILKILISKFFYSIPYLVLVGCIHPIYKINQQLIVQLPVPIIQLQKNVVSPFMYIIQLQKKCLFGIYITIGEPS